MPVQVFRENKLGAVTFAAIGAVCLIATSAAVDSEWTWIGVAFFGVALYWLLPMTLELHPDRILFRSAFRSVDMRLDELDRVWCRITKVRWYGVIPGGTSYSFRLVDDRGRWIRAGTRMKRPEQLGIALMALTSGPLLRKCTQRLNMGQELDLGHIRLGRTQGVTVRKPGRFMGYRTDHIPLDQVSDYAIRNGHVYIWRRGEKFVRGPLFHNVANAIVLEDLLKALCGQAAARA